MRPEIPKLVALCTLVIVLGSVSASATPAAVSPPVEAYLVSGDGASAPRIEVTINRPNITEVQVVTFDEDGLAIGYYSLEPRYGSNGNAEASLDIESGGDRVRSTRIKGFTARSRGVQQPAFDTGRLHAVPMTGCVSFCMAARHDCSMSCWSGSGEAVFSCGPDGSGGCEYTCVCCEYPDCNGP